MKRRNTLLYLACGGLLAGALASEPLPAASPPAAQPAKWRVCDARLVRLIDGDTLVVDLHLGGDVVLKGQRIRALGYDAWEVSKRRRTVTVTDAEIVKGKAAGEALDELIRSAEGFTLKTRILRDGSTARDPFGRILAELHLEVRDDRGQLEAIDVALWMRRHGHCRPDR